MLMRGTSRYYSTCHLQPNRDSPASVAPHLLMMLWYISACPTYLVPNIDHVCAPHDLLVATSRVRCMWTAWFVRPH